MKLTHQIIMLLCGGIVIIAACMLCGCAVTSVRVESTKANGDAVRVEYYSGKNIEAELNSNGTWRVKADASTVIDAQTRAIAVVAGAVAEGAAKGAK